MNAMRFSLLVFALAASAASVMFPEGDDIPATDSCDISSVEGVSSLTMLAAGGGDSIALSDKQVMQRVYGSQGGAMLPMRFQLEGEEVPACAKFTLTLDRCQDLDCESVVADSTFERDVALATYEEGSARVTKDYYFILLDDLQEGSLIRLQVQAGLGTQERLLWIDRIGEFPETLPDAGILDAGQVLDAGTAVDANSAVDAGP